MGSGQLKRVRNRWQPVLGLVTAEALTAPTTPSFEFQLASQEVVGIHAILQNANSQLNVSSYVASLSCAEKLGIVVSRAIGGGCLA